MKIAILGFGVVGSGVADVLESHKDVYEKRVGAPLELGYILERRSLKNTKHADSVVSGIDTILKDPEVKVVVETMGGVDPALTFTKKCLMAKKHVVSSNKELVAAHGAALLKIARENAVNYLFEASVGGGIPLIYPIVNCLKNTQINEICGILNGTTNFILTRMLKEGLSFEEALKQAKENGFAEADPTDDIEGNDVCRKICILSSLAFGRHIYPQWVSTQGIVSIDKSDILAAQSAGYAVKLIGRVKKIGAGISASVYPALVPQSGCLANVENEFNAVIIDSQESDKVMFYGKGAGKNPTAAAVLMDVVNAINAGENIADYYWEDSSENMLVADSQVYARMIRIKCTGSKNERDLFGKTKEIYTKDSDECWFITAPLDDRKLQEYTDMARGLGAEVIKSLSILEY